MESIIDHLYYYTMECEGPFKRQNISDEEEALYDEVIKTLDEKQKALFIKYADASLYRHFDGEKECYHLGFRAGVQLALEIQGKDFSIQFP